MTSSNVCRTHEGNGDFVTHEDNARFWRNKLKITPDYFKIQDPDRWKVGLAEPPGFARDRNKSVVLGIDNNLFQNGPDGRAAQGLGDTGHGAGRRARHR
jgi:hypothetical protein